jgi:hypothetical protein
VIPGKRKGVVTFCDWLEIAEGCPLGSLRNEGLTAHVALFCRKRGLVWLMII